MRITYDESADALYVRLAPEDIEIEHTPVLDRDTLVDIDSKGRAVGIEVLHPARQWPLERIIKDFYIGQADALVLRSLWMGRNEMKPRARMRDVRH